MQQAQTGRSCRVCRDQFVCFCLRDTGWCPDVYPFVTARRTVLESSAKFTAVIFSHIATDPSIDAAQGAKHAAPGSNAAPRQMQIADHVCLYSNGWIKTFAPHPPV
ncbi:unnamed protein product [Ectocarpus sp. 4 AP-2014]